MEQIDWDQDGNGVTFASDMGFKVGEWPAKIEARGRIFRFSGRETNADNELTVVKYTNGDGDTIKVFND